MHRYLATMLIVAGVSLHSQAATVDKNPRTVRVGGSRASGVQDRHGIATWHVHTDRT
jgi:hypothetical protein